MDFVQVILLALIQGITEFLPISSSAHLILPKEVLGWPDQGLAFDVAVHVGTLIAVVVYFRKEVQAVVVGGCRTLSLKRSSYDKDAVLQIPIVAVFKGGYRDADGILAWKIVIATIPACVAGLVFSDFIEAHLRSALVIASTTIAFGILLAVADKTGGQAKTLAELTFWGALAIGMAQALALVPGTSRSGITITMALFLSLSRSDAARFSFLMSIPIIVLSGAHEAMGLYSADSVNWLFIGTGVMVSSLSAYLCIHFFLGVINKISMMPFVVYRLVLGVILLLMIW